MAQLSAKRTRAANVPIFLIAILVAAFLISLFGNIAHPLLWNDEAETAEYGQRILRFGYPKVWDSRNVLNLFEGPDRTVSVSQPLDAYVGSTWGQYYVAAAGVLAANYTNDLYTKTALVRIPFAAAGLLGIAVFAEAVSAGLCGRRRLWFLVLFSTMILLSVPLVLHLREARYYSLVVLQSACIFSVYLRFRFYRRLGLVPYTAALSLLLLAVLNTFFPAFAIAITFIAVSESCLFAEAAWRKREDRAAPGPTMRCLWRDYAKGLLPLVLSSGMAVPFLSFYKIAQLTEASTSLYGASLQRYVENLVLAIYSLLRYDFLFIAAIVNALSVSRLQRVFGLFVVIYLLFIARVPTLYTRYFIVLTPILITIVALGIAGMPARRSVFVSIGVLSLYALANLGALQGHLQELWTPYRGPLDFAIPYIQRMRSDPSEIVIATNYEEPVYMYYLGSRVTVGYVRNDPAGDLRFIPDVIVSRQGRPHVDLLRQLSQNGPYTEVYLPVSDNPWNNIPELTAHLFVTKLPANREESLRILVK